MNQEMKFLEKLRELKVEVSSHNRKMTDEELCAYFEQESLSAAQLQMIRDYMEEDDKNEDELSEDDRAYLEECEEMYAGIPALDTSNLSLYEKVIAGDRQVYETLAAQYMTKVLDVAKAHKTEGILLEELVSEGFDRSIYMFILVLSYYYVYKYFCGHYNLYNSLMLVTFPSRTIPASYSVTMM